MLDERGKVASVRPVQRLVTHKIIEECMIAANVESARRMKKARIPGLYRVHEGPEDERLEELQLFLRTFGFKLGSAEKIAPKELNRIIEQVAGRPEAELIETVILRSLKQARYQPNNVGHFGLALTDVRALHVADSPLSRPARASRDSSARTRRAARRASAIRSRRWSSSASTLRARSGEPTKRRATSRSSSSAST